MVYDIIANYKNYEADTRVYQALKFLAETDLSEAEFGRYEIDGDNLYYLVQDYTPNIESIKPEAHRKYIDIQAILSGEEIIGIAPLSGPKTEVDARPEKDVWFYDCALQPLKLFAGSFMIFYPGDIHAPGIPGCDPVRCRKIVMKIKID